MVNDEIGNYRAYFKLGCTVYMLRGMRMGGRGSTWLQKHMNAFTNGVKSLLRSEIIRNYEKYTDRGYCPIYAREPLSHVYEAYHALGGNSTATDLYKKTMALPSDPPSDPHEE